MRIRKAVLTAAGPRQRTLPLQTLIDRDGVEKSVLRILVEEVVRANIEEICMIVSPGDETAFAAVAGEHAGRLRFVHQTEPRGYGDAVFRARPFVGDEAFLHLVGDHLHVPAGERGCAERLVELAAAEGCSVSAVQATRESLLRNFGAVGGQPVARRQDLYLVDTVLEKPTPTEAEQRLVVPGLRTGHYLCFFGLHVLTPAVLEILGRLLADGAAGVTLSAALAELAAREKYLALRESDRRYDLGAKYGLLTAQIALGLAGSEREEVLARLLELLALRESDARPR
ncbi:MAG: UTP--glucose-1-phosphate uridylyltransferase [Acidobacteria bacterium]|nr:UTP--glucose-1-phosphate uridylyltransferase [Acidobacteriota bacterium]